LLPGDSLLLCSDGMSRMVSEEAMAETLGRYQQPQEICQTLVDLANQNGGEDNITVVIAQVLPEGWWQRLWSFVRR
jgi:serine/threonine protein phosphatase PrpC